MKFRMFTDIDEGKGHVAIDVSKIAWIEESQGHTILHLGIGSCTIEVAEDFHTVISRLNTIAE